MQCTAAQTGAAVTLLRAETDLMIHQSCEQCRTVLSTVQCTAEQTVQGILEYSKSMLVTEGSLQEQFIATSRQVLLKDRCCCLTISSYA